MSELFGTLWSLLYFATLYMSFHEAIVALLHLSIRATSCFRYSNIDTNDFLNSQNVDHTLVLLNMNATRKECGAQISSLV